VRITRSNLAVAGVASSDQKEPALNRVHLDPDGSTVASNGSALLAVGPPDAERIAAFPSTDHEEPELPEDGIGVNLKTVADIKRNLPAEKRIALQQTAITRCDQEQIDLLMTDGTQAKILSTAPMRGKFPYWKQLISSARGRATKARICVNRRLLIKLLRALDEACPDRGNFTPVFLEIGDREDALILRSQNYETRQRAVGLLVPTAIKDNGWLDESEWEQEVFDESSSKPKPKAKVKAKRKLKVKRKPKIRRKTT